MSAGLRLSSEKIVRREEFWLTSKVHPRHLGFEATARQVGVSLAELNTEYLDLLILHYPECWGDLCAGSPPHRGIGNRAGAPWRLRSQQAR